ncbi:hypothetical protein LCGC14_1948470 [marine sediment metagenome]|uniref:Uncharacterized protein n=1 Tax=marine sediment metagenome TaxID=412755 RepID=A0A0F9FI27_9ZZZZ
MAVAFGPEQFRQAGEGLTPPPSITLAESQRRAVEPEGEFGQYGSEVEAFRAFRRYVQEVTQGTKDVNVIGWRRHGLYAGWVRIGRPPSAPTVRPIPRAELRPLEEKGITEELLGEAGIPTAPPTPQAQISEILAAGPGAQEGLDLLGGAGAAEVDPATGREGFWGPDGWFWEKDEFGEFQRTDFDPARRTQPLAPTQPTGLTPFQQAQQEQREQEFQATQQRLTAESEATRLFREQQFGFQREQLEADRLFRELQLTADREERLAQLAAQPISWLQHAALSGQTPVVQPWMIPLMRPGQNLQVGQPIPGFQPALPGGAVEQGGFLPGTATPAPVGSTFANLPELRRPSAQLFARMGPTAQQQFLGFRQARTGIPPQETLFRQRQTGPPGTPGGGFQQQRFRV